MMKIIERIFNAETGETVDIERDETAAEKKEREISQKQAAIAKTETDAKNAEKQALLDRLGITADEAKLLLG
jgi:hypothetical protein